MKRKAGIFLIVSTTFLSSFGGGGAMLAAGSNLIEMEPSVQIQQNHTEQTPSAIAGNSRDDRDDRGGGSDDKNDKNDKENGLQQAGLGNSWGG